MLRCGEDQIQSVKIYTIRGQVMKKTMAAVLAAVMLAVFFTSCASHASVDVDLTVMNSQMVYSTVYDMVNNPDNYLGKTVRISGLFTYNYFEPTDKDYYYCIVPDATECCQQGIEFIWSGASSTSDYPEKNARITISGVYGSYDELGITYYYLSVDSIA